MVGLSTLDFAKIAAPALVVALSPIPAIIALVLLIHNNQPRASSIAYLLGRLTALAMMVLASYSIPQPSDALHRPFPHWVRWMTVAIGAAFVTAGALLLKRHQPSKPTSLWHNRIGGISPRASAALGLLPAFANPKVVAASIAANAEIRALPSTSGNAIALICYLALATSTVAAPIFIYLLLGARIDPKLERLRQRIQRHHNATIATTLIIIGVTVMLYGLVNGSRKLTPCGSSKLTTRL